MLRGDKFAASIMREILAVGSENQSDEITFLLQLFGRCDELAQTPKSVSDTERLSVVG